MARRGNGHLRLEKAPAPANLRRDNLRSPSSAELEQPKKRLRDVRPRRRGYPEHMPGRVQSVDLTVWTVPELEALQMWLELELSDREELEREREWEERCKTVVSVRYVHEAIRCGKPTCRCAEEGGELHGPYWYRIETFGNGRSRKKYHGKKPPPALARQVPLPFAGAKEKRKETTERGPAPKHTTNSAQRDARARAV